MILNLEVDNYSSSAPNSGAIWISYALKRSALELAQASELTAMRLG